IEPSGSSSPQGLTQLGSILVFLADTQANGREVWRTDGTPAGTQLIADLIPGPTSGAIGDMAIANGLLFYVGVGPNGWQVFQTDGTAAGTGPTGTLQPGAVAEHLVSNGQLVFWTERGISSNLVNLW